MRQDCTPNRTWREVVAAWPVELDAPARLTECRRIWLETTAAAVRAIRICSDLQPSEKPMPSGEPRPTPLGRL